MVKLVDTLLSGGSASRRVGSSPIMRTKGYLHHEDVPFAVTMVPILLRVMEEHIIYFGSPAKPDCQQNPVFVIE